MPSPADSMYSQSRPTTLRPLPLLPPDRRLLLLPRRHPPRRRPLLLPRLHHRRGRRRWGSDGLDASVLLPIPLHTLGSSRFRPPLLHPHPHQFRRHNRGSESRLDPPNEYAWGGAGRIATATDRRIIYREARSQSIHEKMQCLCATSKAGNRQDQKGKRERMSSWREYPERPIVGVGGVVIENGRALLIRRGTEPLLGQWSIPGGTLELGETLAEGTARELKEETGLDVDVLELIEVFERINFGHGADESWTTQEERRRPRFHFVIVDFLCERTAGSPIAGGDVTDVAWAAEDELDKFAMTPTATRVICKAFSLARLRK